ncbi:glycerophosphodiester phosphodiesterase domain-containing protein 5-like [Haliotis rubra]|uniref:glycerophosphodiester phosphodiesterase domain-containing protein 5-like n=1 Tax=Haliotis rubra TaxID=36100 RepID=UPI001EE4FB08|nr:glycerophosphodiester phosphodiesterase domain-containing protein 5-like [Haliotis rubra]
MKGKLVSHAKLQYYRHNYCLVCMTGMLGCRWHRYKQSTRDSRKRDLFWFSLFCLTFLYIIFYFYFWLIVRNSFDDLNWHMFGLLRTWVPWYRIILGLTCAVFAYFIIVMCLVLCHVLHGHQLYIHPVHIAVIIFSLLGCVAVTVAVEMMWQSEWTLVLLSLRITGPFLQIGAVVLMTLMTWIISLQWFKLSHWGY